MKKALLVALLLISTFAIQAQDAPVFIVQGTITDLDTREPIEGIKVELSIDGKSVAELETNEEGFYSFDTKPKKVLIDGKKVKERYILANTTYLITVIPNEEYDQIRLYEQIQAYVSTKGINESKTLVRDFRLQCLLKEKRPTEQKSNVDRHGY